MGQMHTPKTTQQLLRAGQQEAMTRFSPKMMSGEPSRTHPGDDRMMHPLWVQLQLQNWS